MHIGVVISAFINIEVRSGVQIILLIHTLPDMVPSCRWKTVQRLIILELTIPYDLVRNPFGQNNSGGSRLVGQEQQPCDIHNCYQREKYG